MVNSAFLRKAVLVIGLAGALYASFLMPDDVQGYQSAPAPEVPAVPLVSVTVPPVAALQEADTEDSGGDPFAPRNWMAPAPAQEPVKPGAPTREVAALALPQGPPALPFKFAGRMNDGDDQVIYLARGETGGGAVPAVGVDRHRGGRGAGGERGIWLMPNHFMFTTYLSQ